MPVNSEASRLFAYHVEFCREDQTYYQNSVLLGAASMKVLDAHNTQHYLECERTVDPWLLRGTNLGILTEKFMAQRGTDGWRFQVELLDNTQLNYNDRFPNLMMNAFHYHVPDLQDAIAELVCKRLLLHEQNAPRPLLPTSRALNLGIAKGYVNNMRFRGGNAALGKVLKFVKLFQNPEQVAKMTGKIEKDYAVVK